MITLVISATELEGEEVVVDGHVYRHLFRARRMTGNESVRFVDGAGSARFGRPLKVEADSARFDLGQRAPANEPSRHVELLAPVPKASRLSWMVEKATEIGVSAIRLMHTERAPRGLGRGTLERLGRVAIAAVQQCQRSVVPQISGVHTFDEIPDILASIPCRWFLQPGAAVADPEAADTRAALLVGPEGGWTEEELERLSAWGCRPVGMGPTVLRVETAATVGCAALLLAGRE